MNTNIEYFIIIKFLFFLQFLHCCESLLNCISLLFLEKSHEFFPSFLQSGLFIFIKENQGKYFSLGNSSCPCKHHLPNKEQNSHVTVFFTKQAGSWFGGSTDRTSAGLNNHCKIIGSALAKT